MREAPGRALLHYDPLATIVSWKKRKKRFKVRFTSEAVGDRCVWYAN